MRHCPAAGRSINSIKEDNLAGTSLDLEY